MADDKQTGWFNQQIEELAAQQTDFQKRAFLLALEPLEKELVQRTEQLNGELDARMWNPQDW